MDFTKYFKEYENIVATADNAFEQVKQAYPECMSCRINCADCCYAVFDIGLIEALYINWHFNDKIGGANRDFIIGKANKADRKAYQLKKRAYKEVKDGKNEQEVVVKMSLERIECPLLTEYKLCALYDYRPITCRLYGIPIHIGGLAHTCGRTGFEENKEYKTVKIEILQQKLYDLSVKVIKDIKSKHPDLFKMLIPVSMALLTEYNEEALGVPINKEKQVAE
ncbi:MAG: YkgJ family cysteine cluster protein [Deltaproteobacteria bacterium]|nr:YkgJ family cysteine cluster protein [Deltaproteobacteria bacterium]